MIPTWPVSVVKSPLNLLTNELWNRQVPLFWHNILNTKWPMRLTNRSRACLDLCRSFLVPFVLFKWDLGFVNVALMSTQDRSVADLLRNICYLLHENNMMVTIRWVLSIRICILPKTAFSVSNWSVKIKTY